PLPYIGFGWITPSTRGGRPFWGRPGTSHSTTSACWSATSAKPKGGPGRTAVPSSNCTPMPLTPRRPGPRRYDNSTRYIRKPLRHRLFASVCCTAATARSLHPGATRCVRRWSHPSLVCCWPATPSASTCPWRSWNARRPPDGAPPTNCWDDGGWPGTHWSPCPPKDGHRYCGGLPPAKDPADDEHSRTAAPPAAVSERQRLAPAGDPARAMGRPAPDLS